MNVSESLQEYAARTRRTPEAAYADWHAGNVALSMAYRKPFTARYIDGKGQEREWEHVTLGGGALGLTRKDLAEARTVQS